MRLGRRRNWIWGWKTRSTLGFNQFDAEMISLYLIVRARGRAPLGLSFGDRYWQRHVNGLVRRTFLETSKPLAELTGRDIAAYCDRHYPRSVFPLKRGVA